MSKRHKEAARLIDNAEKSQWSNQESAKFDVLLAIAYLLYDMNDRAVGSTNPPPYPPEPKVQPGIERRGWF